MAFAPRIHVLLAGKAPVGLVFRRGPSKTVATLLWDRRSDEFTLGQWLRGRIYERRSDLSPDGKYLLYAATKGMWESESPGSWTAISRAPYLKPLAMFPKADDCHGGGLWTGNATYWLNDGSGHSILKNSSAVRRDAEFQPAADYGAECPGVYYLRLMREGWNFIQRVQAGALEEKDIFEKPLTRGWALRKIAHTDFEAGQPGWREGQGRYWDEHALVHAESSTLIPYPTWEWADLDGKRLVWGDRARLFTGQVKNDGLANETELYDFSGMRSRQTEAPY